MVPSIGFIENAAIKNTLLSNSVMTDFGTEFNDQSFRIIT
jgi:hypothetical protein